MSDPRLPASEEQVRRLLAEARHDAPMPDDVADRLDRVLADLRPPSPTGPEAGDRAARRRRTLRNLVLAAAAVVVVGVGGTVGDHIDLSDGGGGADSAVSGATSMDSGGSAEAGDETRSKALADRPPGRIREGYSGARDSVRITAASFERVARQLATWRAAARGGTLSQWSADTGAPLASQPDGQKRDGPELDGQRALSRLVSCVHPDWGAGRGIAARYEGAPAMVVLRPKRDGERVVDLYRCGEAEPIRSTTVPAG